jgi:hypothetical protein
MCGAAARSLSKVATPLPLGISISKMMPRTLPFWMRVQTVGLFLIALDLQAFVCIILKRVAYQSGIRRMAFDQKYGLGFRWLIPLAARIYARTY